MHTPIDEVSIGHYPQVSRLLKGAFHSRPLLPQYSGTWDISCRVLAYLNQRNLEDSELSLKLLILRTVMLLVLTHASIKVSRFS